MQHKSNFLVFNNNKYKTEEMDQKAYEIATVANGQKNIFRAHAGDQEDAKGR